MNNKEKLEIAIANIDSLRFKNQSSFEELQSLIINLISIIEEIGGRPKSFITNLKIISESLNRPNLKSKTTFQAKKKELTKALSTITSIVD